MSPARIRSFEAPPAHTRGQRMQRHTCSACRARRARFRYRGEVRADTDHDLCFRCFRALRDRMRRHVERAAA
jgi:hypothetical protein